MKISLILEDINSKVELLAKQFYSDTPVEQSKHIIGGRWPEAENVIAKNAEAAYLYARDVIKDRWPQGEAAISKLSNLWKVYKEKIIDRPPPKAKRPDHE